MCYAYDDKKLPVSVLQARKQTHQIKKYINETVALHAVKLARGKKAIAEERFLQTTRAKNAHHTLSCKYKSLASNYHSTSWDTMNALAWQTVSLLLLFNPIGCGPENCCVGVNTFAPLLESSSFTSDPQSCVGPGNGEFSRELELVDPSCDAVSGMLNRARLGEVQGMEIEDNTACDERSGDDLLRRLHAASGYVPAPTSTYANFTADMQLADFFLHPKANVRTAVRMKQSSKFIRLQ